MLHIFDHVTYIVNYSKTASGAITRRNHLPQRLQGVVNPQMYHSSGLKILNLDFKILLQHLLFYYFTCSLQCQSFKVWKGLPAGYRFTC